MYGLLRAIYGTRYFLSACNHFFPAAQRISLWEAEAKKSTSSFFYVPRERAFICLVTVLNMHRISHDNNISARVHAWNTIFYWKRSASCEHIRKASRGVQIAWSVQRCTLVHMSHSARCSSLVSLQWRITMHSFPFASLIATHIFCSHTSDLWTGPDSTAKDFFPAFLCALIPPTIISTSKPSKLGGRALVSVCMEGLMAKWHQRLIRVECLSETII